MCFVFAFVLIKNMVYVNSEKSAQIRAWIDRKNDLMCILTIRLKISERIRYGWNHVILLKGTKSQSKINN
jgi:hypothetical protein